MRGLADGEPAFAAELPEAGLVGDDADGLLGPVGDDAPLRVEVELALDGAQPVGSTPAEFAALIRRELDKWARVVRAAGIELQ